MQQLLFESLQAHEVFSSRRKQVRSAFVKPMMSSEKRQIMTTSNSLAMTTQSVIEWSPKDPPPPDFDNEFK